MLEYDELQMLLLVCVFLFLNYKILKGIYQILIFFVFVGCVRIFFVFFILGEILFEMVFLSVVLYEIQFYLDENKFVYRFEVVWDLFFYNLILLNRYEVRLISDYFGNCFCLLLGVNYIVYDVLQGDFIWRVGFFYYVSLF